jgi:hypothetical protein
MTKFKKCDYCKQKGKDFHKLKSQNDLFDGKKRLGDTSGGGYIKEIPIIMFLCNTCYDYFFEDANPNEGTDLTKIPELYEVMTKKIRKIF